MEEVVMCMSFNLWNVIFKSREEQYSDNFFNATLGITLKLGKHHHHLMWHDPFKKFIIDLMF